MIRLLVLLISFTTATAAAATSPNGSLERAADAHLAPLHASGPLAEARAAFHDGRHDEALRLYSAYDDGSFDAGWLHALSAWEVGDAETAAAILERLQGEPSPLSDRIAWQLALARDQLGDREGAIAACRKIPEGSLFWGESRILGARLLGELEKSEEALAWLAPLLERGPPAWGNDRSAEALYLAAELREGRGEKKEARQLFLRIWSRHALSPRAEEALQRALALDPSPPSAAERVERARVYLDAHRNQEAIAQLETLRRELKIPDPLACEATFYLGRGYRKTRQHSKVLPTLQPVADQCADETLQARALYLLGTSTTVVGRERAIPVWRRLAETFPEHSFADDALFFAAELHRRAEQPDEARRTLQKLVREHPKGDFRAEALFRLFWLERQQGRLEEGLAALQRIEAEYADADATEDVERALYWQGRAYAELGQRVPALAAYRKLLEAHPTSYYALLARGRLQAMDADVAQEVIAWELAKLQPAKQEIRLHTRWLEEDPHFRAGVVLLRMGFSREAAAELLRVDRRRLAERAEGSLEPLATLTHYLERAEARRAAHQIARTEMRALLRGRPSGERWARFAVAFPMAYRELVERHAATAKVPADLLQALMREESSLDPDVVSWAGAIGLTQLMPATAREVARRLGMGAVTPASLRDPSTNLRLGSAYLGSLLERWGGNMALAAASYNAGPGAVSRWLAERGHLELDEFVEEIPIDQTRNYVKRVLASYGTYRLVYAAHEAGIPKILPGTANEHARRASR